MSADTPVAKRWRRFDQDRLYVRTPDGAEVGWTDLQTGRSHPASPEQLAALTVAVANWKKETNWVLGVSSGQAAPSLPGPVAERTSRPSAPMAPAPATAPSPSLLESAAAGPWRDLAANVPGAEARAMANALRRAAPVRTFLNRLVAARTPERAWRIGADGEELVAAELARLVHYDPRWRVLHAIPVGDRGADIDHLVMGPNGVFSLNTKHHPGASVWVGGDTFLVNGRREPYIRKSRFEASRATKLLAAATRFRVPVRGVIVPVGIRGLRIKSEPGDVSVIPHRHLLPWLLGYGRLLDDASLWTLTQAARRSTTWRPMPG